MSMRVTPFVPLVALVLALPPLAASAGQAAQATPPAESQPPQPQGAPQTPAAPLDEPQAFTYDPEGRRDPFVSLLGSGGVGLGPAAGSRPAGLAGLTTDEVTLKGTIESQTGFVGILLGTDGRTYIVRPGERLLDGTIRAITQDAVVILQQVNDPLSLAKQREVRKPLRQTEAN